jgi:hypothetical protein
LASIRKYIKTKTNLDMIGTLKRKNLRKDIWFFSMRANTYNIQENSGCIGEVHMR